MKNTVCRKKFQSKKSAALQTYLGFNGSLDAVDACGIHKLPRIVCPCSIGCDGAKLSGFDIRVLITPHFIDAICFVIVFFTNNLSNN